MLFTEVMEEGIKKHFQQGVRYFTITYTNGTKCVKRLFLNGSDIVCEFKPRSRKWGYIFDFSNVESVVPKLDKSDEIDVCHRNLNKVVKSLLKSGLWEPMLKGAEYLLSLSNEDLLSMKNDYDIYVKMVCNKGVKWFSYDCFLNLFDKRSVKTMNFDNWNKESIKKALKTAYTERNNYNHRWHKNYDNSVEIRHDIDYNRGWYSEEYKGCANGYYYFMLDETYAIFGEKD